MEGRPLTAAVLTISDRASRGESPDRSGPALIELLSAAGFRIMATAVVPDERSEIGDRLRTWADRDDVALICTTGGTGLAPRDVTPEATREVLEREAAGITEAMRSASVPATPQAMLSRAVAGVRGRTLIINLPGSPKAVRECFAVIAPVLRHAVGLIGGEISPHQSP